MAVLAESLASLLAFGLLVGLYFLARAVLLGCRAGWRKLRRPQPSAAEESDQERVRRELSDKFQRVQEWQEREGR